MCCKLQESLSDVSVCQKSDFQAQDEITGEFCCKAKQSNMDLCITVLVLSTLLLFCCPSALTFTTRIGEVGILVNIRKILINWEETSASFKSPTLNLRGLINHFFSSTAVVFWRIFTDKCLHLLLYHKATADCTLVWYCVNSLNLNQYVH